MDFVLFGIQGSGKGTQARVLIEKKNLAYFETGAALRSLASENSELGKKVKSIIEAGHLVPNEVVMEIIADFMKKLPVGKDILFDGIPRQKEQAKTFDGLMQSHKRNFACVVLNLSRQKAEERLLTRRICTVCRTIYPASYKGSTCECGGALVTRTDDNADSIKTRLEVFEKETMPVIEEYRERNMVIDINGDQSIEDVSQELLKKI